MYVVGIDFGTLSARAVVVAADDGAVARDGVARVPAGVIDERCPPPARRCRRRGRCRTRRTGSTALRTAVPAARGRRGASTPARRRDRHRLHRIDPAPRDARRNAALPSSRASSARPHAYPKLWKHHAAQPQAERVTARRRRARRVVAGALRRPHLLGVAVRQGAPGARGGPARSTPPTERWIEAADWIVWQLCGAETRNVCTAGYKGIFQDGSYPSAYVPRARSTRTSRDFVGDKLD